VLKPEEKEAFIRDRQGAVVGRKLAAQVRLEDRRPDPCAPSTRHLDLRCGIWTAPRPRPTRTRCSSTTSWSTRASSSAFPAAATAPAPSSSASTSRQCALISQHIDAEFRNSLAETLSETEAAFQLSFVSMSDAILAAIQAVSFIIIVIIMAVMANTMTMTARERLSEYATLKALGFRRASSSPCSSAKAC
jgi:putative ABC transport system permease protein